jgi:hypothetical protein
LDEHDDVDFWIVPESSEYCLLTVARLLLFRRWGVNAGLVRGAGAASWSHGTKRVDVHALAEHLDWLRQNSKWPRSSHPHASVLLSCTTPAQVKSVKRQLRLKGWLHTQLARLESLPFTLSEQGTTAGFCLERFLQAPSTEPVCELTRRCKKAIQTAHISHGGVCALSHPHPVAGAFRRMLFA